MDVISTGLLPVASVLWQPRPSSWSLTVVAKATYDLAPAESPLAAQQEPIVARDEHWEGDGARSLRVASDLAPLKLGADVVLVGQAYAPPSAPARSVLVRMVVGAVDKSIEVFCDRYFDQQGVLREGPRFSHMPLVYERAAGGPDTWNPAGVRRGARDRYGRVALPNLQPPGKLVTAPDDPIEPVGFGPIAPGWPPRREKLRGHAAGWSPDALADQPLPPDVDRAYFNVAPPDQRPAELRAGERIVLEHLLADHPRLITSLAGVRPRAVVTRPSGGPQEILLRPDTLAIDTESATATLVFRGQLVLTRAEEEGMVVVATEMPGRPITVDDILEAGRRAMGGAPESLSPESLEIETVEPDGFSTLPFVAPNAPQVVAPFRAPTPEDAARLRAGAAPLPVAPPPAPAPPAAPGAGPRFGAPDWKSDTITLDTSKPLPDLPLTPFDHRAAAPAAPPPARTPPAPPPAPVPPATFAPVEAPPVQPPVRQTIGDMLAGASTVMAAPVPKTAPADAAAGASRDVLVLVWFDEKSLPRIVRKPAWQGILDALQDEPIDPEADDPALSDAPAEVEERAQVFAILDRAAAIDRQGLHDALARAAGKRGKALPPVELVEGDLTLPFDEVATLEAMVSTATPLAGGDEALAGALATAKDFLASPGVKTAPAVAAGLTSRIREVLRHGKRGLPAAEVDAQVDRALLEERRYQKRKVLGGPHLRALLFLEGPDRPPVVVYLPEAIADDLPMAARFRARVVAEVHLAVDESEMDPAALRAAALGRVVGLPSGRA
jgi:hypothetical protein